ncbi:MAG: M48 family metalloprotease [Actinobacteria bacterium]|nr:M48 family metalloprotease [Actinomycetota bacterium]
MSSAGSSPGVVVGRLASYASLMSFGRAAAVLICLSIACAVILAVVSRTPESIRRGEPREDATDPALGARFTDADVERHGRYRMPGYVAFALFTGLEIAMLIVFARGPFERVIARAESLPGGWFAAAAIGAVLVAVVGALLSLPLGYVRGFAMEHAWGLSTQDVGGWLGDRAKSLLVGSVTSVIAALAFFSVVRLTPRLWWVWGWIAFTSLTALIAFAWPVLIAPLFNTFTPIEDRALERRVRDLAAAAHVDIDKVLVADASRRTTAENAYVAGLGASRRMVLYDTLIAGGTEDETALVVAHELGHQTENHIVKNVAIASAGLLVGFALLAWLSGRSGFWAWAGASGISDVRAMPLLLLFVAIMGLLTLPLQSAVSRSFERRADEVAVELTEDPKTAVRVFRRLAFANLADLRPPRIAIWTLYSHPPIPDRIRSVLATEWISP